MLNCQDRIRLFRILVKINILSRDLGKEYNGFLSITKPSWKSIAIYKSPKANSIKVNKSHSLKESNNYKHSSFANNNKSSNINSPLSKTKLQYNHYATKPNNFKRNSRSSKSTKCPKSNNFKSIKKAFWTNSSKSGETCKPIRILSTQRGMKR